uniref:Uncharacterized protein n=1 Tax=Arundo donax TaxID=35708 RepID=A0A0A9C463_ARUDO
MFLPRGLACRQAWLPVASGASPLLTACDANILVFFSSSGLCSLYNPSPPRASHSCCIIPGCHVSLNQHRGRGGDDGCGFGGMGKRRW